MPIFLVLKRRVRHLLAEFRTSCWQNAIFDEMLLTIYSVFVQTYQQVKAQTLFHKKWEAHSVRATMSLSLPLSLSLSLGEAYFFKGGRQLQLYNSWVWLCLRLWARHNFSEMEGIYSFTTSEGSNVFVFVFVFVVVFVIEQSTIFQRWKAFTAIQPVKATMTSWRSEACLGLEENLS